MVFYHISKKMSTTTVVFQKGTSREVPFCYAVIPLPLIEARIISVKVLVIEVILNDTQRVTEALEVHDLAFAQELDGIGNVGIVAESKDVVIGLARLLLCCNGKSATFANKINPIGFILYHIPLKTEYITIFARKLYHILPLAKYITKNSNVLLSELRLFLEFSCLRKCSQ